MLKLGGEACVCQSHAEPVPGTRRGACSILHSPPGTGPCACPLLPAPPGSLQTWGSLAPRLFPGCPQQMRLLLGTGQHLHRAHSSACLVWLHPRERTPTHPPLAPTGESRKCGRAKKEQKKKSQEFWCNPSQAMLCTARHLTQSTVTSLPAETSFPALFGN